MQEYIKKINIGNVEVKNNVFLGPMAGVTDIAFRTICREFGPGLTFTEMASTKAMEFDSKKIKKLNEEESIDIIDINMGCPAPKLVKNGDGAGLLLNIKNVEEILNEAVKVSKKPITVKTRKGFDNSKITAVDVAKIAENAGVSMITIHGRTREEYYSGKADLEIIKKVKDSVSIPVIGNGDIVDVKSARNMFEVTGCDGIMISRGAMGNPWIFKSILEGKDYMPSKEELYETIIKHINLMREIDGEKQANLKLRKHVAWYLKGLKSSTRAKDMVNRAENIEEVFNILSEYFKNLEENYN